MTNDYNKSPVQEKMPREFFVRRLQSIAGFFFLLFLCEHLFTNSQATFLLGDDGKDFISAVNYIHSLPYLPVIECIFIGLPLLLHTWYGIERMRHARLNSFHTDGQTPSLTYRKGFPRNSAFTWQRITSIVLIVAIGLHIYYMRFLKQPKLEAGAYVVELTKDLGLTTVASRLHVKLTPQNDQNALAVSPNVGTAFLLVLRDTYKSPVMCVLYSLYVLIAAFHACNGLWTFFITWGITLSEPSRVRVRYFSNALMLLLVFFGLAAIWGVYWLNLRY